MRSARSPTTTPRATWRPTPASSRCSRTTLSRPGSATTARWWACSSRTSRAGTPARPTSAWCRSRCGGGRARERTRGVRTTHRRGRGWTRGRTRAARPPGRSRGRPTPTPPPGPSSGRAPLFAPACGRSSTPRSPSTSTRTRSSCAYAPTCRPGSSPAPRPSAWRGSCVSNWTRGTRGAPCGGAGRGGRRRRRRSGRRVRRRSRQRRRRGRRSNGRQSRARRLRRGRHAPPSSGRPTRPRWLRQ